MRDAGGMQKAWVWVGNDEDDSETRYLKLVSYRLRPMQIPHLTDLPRRANAGIRVGCASRCLSIASKTRTNFGHWTRRPSSSTVKALMFSHRVDAAVDRDLVPAFAPCKASDEDDMARSRR